MKKMILAGTLTVSLLTTGFSFNAQAQENLAVPTALTDQNLFAATSENQQQIQSYEDLYKMMLISKLAFAEDELTISANKNNNSFTLKVSLEMIKRSYDQDQNLYYEGKEAFYQYYEELKKTFGDSIQVKFIKSGDSFKAEIYAEGKWHQVTNEEVQGIIMLMNRADFDLKSGGYFKDSIGHWAESYIQFLYQMEIVNGTSDTTFNPNGQVTRGQLAGMIFRATGLDKDADYEGPATYTDLQNFWGAKEVAILQDYGLIDIFDGSKFEPNKPVTREEMAYVTASLLVAQGLDPEAVGMTNTFTDQNQMREETIKPIGLLQQLELIGGENGKFNPKGNLTRAQFSKIMTLSLFVITEE